MGILTNARGTLKNLFNNITSQEPLFINIHMPDPEHRTINMAEAILWDKGYFILGGKYLELKPLLEKEFKEKGNIRIPTNSLTKFSNTENESLKKLYQEVFSKYEEVFNKNKDKYDSGFFNFYKEKAENISDNKERVVNNIENIPTLIIATKTSIDPDYIDSGALDWDNSEKFEENQKIRNEIIEYARENYPTYISHAVRDFINDSSVLSNDALKYNINAFLDMYDDLQKNDFKGVDHYLEKSYKNDTRLDNIGNKPAETTQLDNETLPEQQTEIIETAQPETVQPEQQVETVETTSAETAENNPPLSISENTGENENTNTLTIDLNNTNYRHIYSWHIESIVLDMKLTVSKENYQKFKTVLEKDLKENGKADIPTELVTKLPEKENDFLKKLYQDLFSKHEEAFLKSKNLRNYPFSLAHFNIDKEKLEGISDGKKSIMPNMPSMLKYIRDAKKVLHFDAQYKETTAQDFSKEDEKAVNEIKKYVRENYPMHIGFAVEHFIGTGPKLSVDSLKYNINAFLDMYDDFQKGEFEKNGLDHYLKKSYTEDTRLDNIENKSATAENNSSISISENTGEDNQKPQMLAIEFPDFDYKPENFWFVEVTLLKEGFTVSKENYPQFKADIEKLFQEKGKIAVQNKLATKLPENENDFLKKLYQDISSKHEEAFHLKDDDFKNDPYFLESINKSKEISKEISNGKINVMPNMPHIIGYIGEAKKNLHLDPEYKETPLLSYPEEYQKAVNEINKYVRENYPMHIGFSVEYFINTRPSLSVDSLKYNINAFLDMYDDFQKGDFKGLDHYLKKSYNEDTRLDNLENKPAETTQLNNEIQPEIVQPKPEPEVTQEPNAEIKLLALELFGYGRMSIYDKIIEPARPGKDAVLEKAARFSTWSTKDTRTLNEEELKKVEEILKKLGLEYEKKKELGILGQSTFNINVPLDDIKMKHLLSIYCTLTGEEGKDYVGQKDQLATIKKEKQNITQSEKEQPITLSTTTPEPITDADKSFKDPYSKFWSGVAKKRDATYTEGKQSDNFDAVIEDKKTKERLRITANANNEVSMSAMDGEKKAKVPNQEDFNELAKFAHQQGRPIQFADIKTPEFKARLMLACLTHEPPIKMIDAPVFDDKFMSQIDEETRENIAKELNKTPKESKTLDFGEKVNNLIKQKKGYEIPFPENITSLSAKKLNISKEADNLIEIRGLDENGKVTFVYSRSEKDVILARGAEPPETRTLCIGNNDPHYVKFLHNDRVIKLSPKSQLDTILEARKLFSEMEKLEGYAINAAQNHKEEDKSKEDKRRPLEFNDKGELVFKKTGEPAFEQQSSDDIVEAVITDSFSAGEGNKKEEPAKKLPLVKKAKDKGNEKEQADSKILDPQTLNEVLNTPIPVPQFSDNVKEKFSEGYTMSGNLPESITQHGTKRVFIKLEKGSPYPVVTGYNKKEVTFKYVIHNDCVHIQDNIEGIEYAKTAREHNFSSIGKKGKFRPVELSALSEGEKAKIDTFIKDIQSLPQKAADAIERKKELETKQKQEDKPISETVTPVDSLPAGEKNVEETKAPAKEESKEKISTTPASTQFSDKVKEKFSSKEGYTVKVNNKLSNVLKTPTDNIVIKIDNKTSQLKITGSNNEVITFEYFVDEKEAPHLQTYKNGKKDFEYIQNKDGKYQFRKNDKQAFKPLSGDYKTDVQNKFEAIQGLPQQAAKAIDPGPKPAQKFSLTEIVSNNKTL